MSGAVISANRERLRAVLSQLRAAVAVGSGAVRSGKRPDVVGRLIDLADLVEAGFAALLRGSRLLGRSALVHMTGGIVWRGLAAATGIGLTATLVAALSSGPAETALPTLASVTAVDAPAGPAVRDVRLQATPAMIGHDGWVQVTRPIALFGLESPELDRRTSYEARRNRDGSRREDILSFGEFGEGKPFLAVKFQVNRDAEAQSALTGLSQPFVITLVRESAERGLSVGRSGAATMIETKFGTVETADVALSDGAVGRACIGFRHLDGAAHFSFSGWWCGSEAKPADRAQLICLIDRIDLLSAGDDRDLRAAFARIELARKPGCSVPRLSATGRKGSWLDADGKAPALRMAAGKQAQPR